MVCCTARGKSFTVGTKHNAPNNPGVGFKSKAKIGILSVARPYEDDRKRQTKGCKNLFIAFHSFFPNPGATAKLKTHSFTSRPPFGLCYRNYEPPKGRKLTMAAVFVSPRLSVIPLIAPLMPGGALASNK